MRPDPDVVARRLGDQLVLVHLRTDGIYEMNATAARIWELLCEGCDAARMRARLLEEFTAEPAALDSEVTATLAVLRQAELVIADEHRPH